MRARHGEGVRCRAQTGPTPLAKENSSGTPRENLHSRRGQMRFDTVIKNGTVVTATDTYASDVGIAGGKIAAIAQSLAAENAGKVIDAAGLLVMPGGADGHTPFGIALRGTA